MYKARNPSRLKPLLRALSPCIAAAALVSAAPGGPRQQIGASRGA
jgi:hypothetical protein